MERPFLIALTVTALLAAAAGDLRATEAPSAPVSEEVVVALKPDKNPDAMLAEREALARALGEILSRPVRVITPLSSAVIIEGLANGSIDLGYLSATDMVNARQADAADLLLAGLIDGRPQYRSVWLCLVDRPYRERMAGAIQLNDSLLFFAPDEVRNDRSFILEVVTRSRFELKYYAYRNQY